MLRARTLIEGHVYINLMIADLPPPDGAAADPVAADTAASADNTTTTVGEEAWTLAHDVGNQRIEVVVPYATEATARAAGLRFGAGVSELIDAGQWLLVAAIYARRALAQDLAYDGSSAQRWDDVVLNWGFAVDAAGEALKFLPELAEELPATAFWSEVGERLQLEDPEQFTRARLHGDLAYYRSNLEEFQQSHSRPN